MAGQFDLQSFLKTVAGASDPASAAYGSSSGPPPGACTGTALQGMASPAPPTGVAQMAAAQMAADATALAQAAAGGVAASSADAQRPPVGQPLSAAACVYNIDHPPAVPPELEVSPITVYNTEYNLTLGQTIAVNKKYICYGLKAGQIRVINLFTAGRALMRGHEAPLCDLKFFGEDVDLLGSTAKDGRVFVRRVVESQGADASDITDVPLLSLRLTDDDAQPAAAAPHFGWHASDPNVFAVAAARTVLLCNLETLAAQAGDASTPLAVNLSSPPAGAVVLAGHTGDVHTVCFSPDGSLLASGGEDGSVRIWDVANGACMSSVDAHEGQPVCSVMWAPDAAQPVGASLLTGGELNTQVKLWTLAPGGSALECIQQVSLVSDGDAHNDFFNHARFDVSSGLVLLANTKRNALYALQLTPGATPQLTSLAEFSVLYPILSFTSVCEPAERGVPQVQVYCVQTKSIQNYTLVCARCQPNMELPAVPSAVATAREVLVPQAPPPEEPVIQQPSIPVPEPEVGQAHPVQREEEEAGEEESEEEETPALMETAAPATPAASMPPVAPSTPMLLTPMQLIAQAAAAVAETNSTEEAPESAEATAPQEAEEEEEEDEEEDEHETPVAPTASGVDVLAMLNRAAASAQMAAPAPTPAATRAPPSTPAAIDMIAALAPLVEELRYRDTLMMQRMEAMLMQQRQMADEERIKRDQAERERQEKLLTAISASIFRDLPLQFEKVMRKELSQFSPVVAQLVTQPLQQLVPALERTVGTSVATAMTEQVQKQIAGAFASSFEKTLLPSFENSTREMFVQINAAMEQGVQQHVHAIQQHATPLTESLQSSVAAAASLAETMANEHATLGALLQARGGGGEVGAAGAHESGDAATGAAGGRVDPTVQISHMLAANDYTAAFNHALTLSDVNIVTWLLHQLDPQEVFAMSPPVLNQALLLSLTQQLGCDLGTDAELKLDWMQQTLISLDPEDALLGAHMRPILDQLHHSLTELGSHSTSAAVQRSLRMVVHLVNSLISQCG